jgi:hypothetical protein
VVSRKISIRTAAECRQAADHGGPPARWLVLGQARFLGWNRPDPMDLMAVSNRARAIWLAVIRGVGADEAVVGTVTPAVIPPVAHI